MISVRNESSFEDSLSEPLGLCLTCLIRYPSVSISVCKAEPNLATVTTRYIWAFTGVSLAKELLRQVTSYLYYHGRLLCYISAEPTWTKVCFKNILSR